VDPLYDAESLLRLPKTRWFRSRTWIQGGGVWDPTAHPGLPLEVLLGRTVLPTVARWFVLGARETMDNFIQVRATWRGVTPYFLVWIFMWWDYKGDSLVRRMLENGLDG
jgi:hypothetical protein